MRTPRETITGGLVGGVIVLAAGIIGWAGTKMVDAIEDVEKRVRKQEQINVSQNAQIDAIYRQLDGVRGDSRRSNGTQHR